jgi:hypothetical protein
VISICSYDLHAFFFASRVMHVRCGPTSDVNLERRRRRVSPATFTLYFLRDTLELIDVRAFLQSARRLLH